MSDRARLTRGCGIAAFALAVALIACSGGIADPHGEGGAGLRIVSGAPVSDTIESPVAQPLAVLVVDGNGRAAAGRVVTFEVLPAVPNQYATAVSIAREETAQFGIGVLDTTDSRGRAAVQVRLAAIAGAGSVRITVPDLGYADTARYIMLPGALDHVDVGPADTGLYVGKGYVVRAHGADRWDNERANDPISFSIASGPATIDATTGALVATAIGRASIVATSGSRSSTVHLSVLPQARVATQQHYVENGGPIGIFLMELDGSNRTPLAAWIDNAYASEQGFDWSPDGKDLVIARGDSIDLVTPGTPERRLLKTTGAVLYGARFSRDGQWIYFAQARVGVSRVRRDGSGLELLGTEPALFGQYVLNYRPSPSPDGASVAYVSESYLCGTTEKCIRVIDLATGVERTYGGRSYLAAGTNAAWSPTDDLIGYSAPGEVGVIRSDGSGQRVLATDMINVGWMEWSPDGKWLIVSPDAGPVTLFDIQTGARLPVPTLATYVATAWRP
jgi:hypothetical protein